MKMFVIVSCLFLLISSSVFSQNNIGIVNPDHMWSSIEWIPWGGWYYKTYFNRFEGDTTIDNTNYTKVWQAEDELHSNWYLKGFVREEASGKVYGRNLNGNEGLMYDMNLQVGDYITINNPFFGLEEISTHVVNVDTVIIEPGFDERKRIELAASSFGGKEEYWIEGIGSMAGILWSGMHSFLLTGANYDLACHWVNDELVMTSGVFIACYLPTSIDIEETEKERFEVLVSPNPAKESVNFSFRRENDSFQKIGSISVFDSFGSEVFCQNIQFESLQSFNWNCREANPGIYFYRIETNSKVFKGKIVVNR